MTLNHIHAIIALANVFMAIENFRRAEPFNVLVGLACLLVASIAFACLFANWLERRGLMKYRKFRTIR